MKHVAITDHGTMFGVLDFYLQAKKAGIKPVIGCECYIAPRTLHDKTPLDREGLTHLVLLAQNQEGYKNLCKLSSIAQLEGFYYKPRIDKEILKQHSTGLIALSACLHGEVASRIKEDNIEAADEAAKFYLKTFEEGNFFLEVQNNGIDVQEKINSVLIDMSKRLSIPLVATNDCHYLNKEDSRVHDVLLCIQTSKRVQDTNRLKFNTNQLYFKSKEEMAVYFANYPDAIENSVKIAERCNFEFDFNTYYFPKFEAENKKSIEPLFKKRVTDGFKKVFQQISTKNPNADIDIYQKRLDYEISVIIDMSFCGYFLIVADFIRYAKENKIPVGPGRGSATGSLVAYSLQITDLDPLEYGLFFERFLNPARKSMPDIDVDFCINGREDVFKYVVDKYGGSAYVAQIITFGKLKVKAVIRDVGRALDIPLKKVDTIAKMVPDGLKTTIDYVLKHEPILREQATKKSEIAELFKICRALEGLPRHASTHAAGVVISDKPLVEYMPLYKGKKGEIVTQFDMKMIEKIGLVKFDFLGLRNLTVIENTLSLIKNQKKNPPDLSNLDFDDKKIYKLLSAGDTTGIFQLESLGMKDLIVRLKPTCFNDIIALVALYRPGPIKGGMIDDYVERKHGRKRTEYLIPELEPILKETYGAIVYQEQVMKIASELAKYSMAEADDLRKAMGKKIEAIMIKQRQRFIDGAVENGIKSNKAEQLFDLIEKFGGYGFNKSHSAAYAYISFQTAYLKANFPVEFMAALLTSEMHSSDSVAKYIAECRTHSIEIFPPNINEGSKEFKVTDSSIRFGLAAVKNVGEGSIESIFHERKNNGQFSSIYDFCKRVDLHKVNKRVIESLIKCGAFDFMGNNRFQNLAVLDDAVYMGQKIQKEKKDSQMRLFDNSVSNQTATLPQMPEVEGFNKENLLQFEKESLGFYISGHPLDSYNEILEKLTNADAVSIKEMNVGTMVWIGGIVRNIKVIKTKRDEQMAFVLLEELKGIIELTVFASVYNDFHGLLIEDTPLLIKGRVENNKRDQKITKIIVDTIIHMDNAEETCIVRVDFNLNMDKTDKKKLNELKDILKCHSGLCKAYLKLNYKNRVEAVISLPKSLKVKPGSALTKDVTELLGSNAIKSTINQL
mmetsp:Transcript_22468/g.10801  ORF Transcript_22468/g.10801 Transcript_22468/m.10801 type:complete len:1124 (+) Transcript_22468:87-3458(+)